MSLAAGARLGPYEIIAKLGSGGMGEVWKARDTRLNRLVALKTTDAAFGSRFEREARAIAALSHPNICQLYDVGPDYLVLEYVEGAEIVPTDNVRKLLDVALQITDGLAAAHAAGFVHRDLKPSNVLVSRAGRVKILDFGLAKHTEPEPGPVDWTITSAGLITGTAGYMSPEQARGEADLDARSDQFSVGVMLYELGTGRHPFERSSGVETLMAIVRDDFEPLPPSLPAPLRWIIERCLSKDREQRYASTRDLYLELRGVRDHLAEASVKYEPSPLGAAMSAPWWRGIAIGVAVLLVGGVGALVYRGPGAPHDPDLRYTPLSFEQGGQRYPVWSPDGRAVAFVAQQRSTDPARLYVRNLDSPVGLPITTAAVGGTSQWTSTGKIIVFSPGPPGGLWAIPSVGGEPELFYPMRSFPFDQAAAVARDGSAVALIRQGEDKTFGLWVSSPPSAPAQRYEPAPFAWPRLLNDTRLRFSPDGRYLLLMCSPTVASSAETWLIPYPADPARPPHRILGAGVTGLLGTPYFDWMPDSRHIVVSVAPAPGLSDELLVVNVFSEAQRVLSRGPGRHIQPAASPDGEKLSFLEVNNDFDIVTLDLDTAAVAPLIATSRRDEMPSWGANSLVYVTDRNGAPEIWLHKDGETDHPIVTARNFPDPTKWFLFPELSPDGARIIYGRVSPASAAGIDLWISAVTGGAPVRVLSTRLAVAWPGTWSPDGNSYVFRAKTSNDVDAPVTLFKVRATAQASPEVVKTGVEYGDKVPVWSPDGSWILDGGGPLKLISVDGKTTRDLGEDALCTFARDGQRLFCLRAPETDGSRQLFSMNLEGRDKRTIGQVPADLVPSFFFPLERLALAPDGRKLAYSTMKPAANLWLIDGLGTFPLP